MGEEAAASRQISYEGRVLSCTPEYVAELARAFSAGAYDQVPFQLADATAPQLLYQAIGAAQLRPYVQGQDDRGGAALSN